MLKPIHKALPDVSTVYLGDNARAPYGVRSHEEIFQFALEGVRFLFDQGCPLVVFACNSASAQALRQIQQEVLPNEYPGKRVLGIIRPAAEWLVENSTAGHIGIFGTEATVRSMAYVNELEHFAQSGGRHIDVTQVACPGLTDLIENGEVTGSKINGLVNEYVEKMMTKDKMVDEVMLACTHFPLIKNLFEKSIGEGIQVVGQGEIVAEKLSEYLNNHQELNEAISRTGDRQYFTTKSGDVSELASLFYGEDLDFKQVSL